MFSNHPGSAEYVGTRKKPIPFEQMKRIGVIASATLRRIPAGRKQNVLASRPLCYASAVMTTGPFRNDESGTVPAVSRATSGDYPALKPPSRRTWRGFAHAAAASFAVAAGLASSTDAVAASDGGYALNPAAAIYEAAPGKALDLSDEVTLEAWVKADPMDADRRAHPGQVRAGHAARLHARHLARQLAPFPQRERHVPFRRETAR